MTENFRLLVVLAALAMFSTTQPLFAEGRSVDRIWWDIIINWNNQHQTACIVRNFNDRPVRAVFDFYPNSQDGRDRGRYRTSVFLNPYNGAYENKVFSWFDGVQPPAECTLISWQYANAARKKR